MKILFFSPYYLPYLSGLTIYPANIFNYLSKKNQITILTFRHKKTLPKEEVNRHLRIIRIPYLIKISKGFISPHSFIYFFREIKKNEILLINLPNFEGLFLTFIAKLMGKKIISLYHCQVELENNFVNQVAVFFLNLSTFFQALLSNQIIGHIDYINKTQIGKIFFKKIKTVLPPINYLPAAKSFFKKIEVARKNKILIGHVGRIASEKGIEYLIEAVKDLKNIKLLFAGPFGKEVVGEEKYFEKILKLLKKYRIEYQFLGLLKNSQLGAFYKAIDILVLPSVNQTEAFGMVQAEAMILGTPVIASNLPGVHQPIKLTKMGILIPPKNQQAIKKAILEIINNRQKYTNKNLIKKAQEIFDINKVFQFWEKIIRTVLVKNCP